MTVKPQTAQMGQSSTAAALGMFWAMTMGVVEHVSEVRVVWFDKVETLRANGRLKKSKTVSVTRNNSFLLGSRCSTIRKPTMQFVTFLSALTSSEVRQVMMLNFYFYCGFGVKAKRTCKFCTFQCVVPTSVWSLSVVLVLRNVHAAARCSQTACFVTLLVLCW